MIRKILTTAYTACLGRPWLSAAIAAVVFVIALVLANAFLTIDSNQLNTLPADHPDVIEAKRLSEMAGGAGYLILLLKFSEPDRGDLLMQKAVELREARRDEEAEEYLEQARAAYREDFEENNRKIQILKDAADEIAPQLRALDDVIFVNYRSDLSTVQSKVLLFMKPDDLREALRRVSIKRDEMIERANPFFLDLGQPTYNLDLSDIRRKYERIGKKEIVDDYYVSPGRRALAMLVKPSFSHDDIDRSERLIAETNAIIERAGLGDKGITVGLTGAYPGYVQAYHAIEEGMRPALVIAFIGIAIVLIVFVRRFTLVVSMLAALIYALVLCFGIAAIALPELNIITAMFGGILAGLGVDFGIHLVLRFREEFSRNPNIIPAYIEAAVGTAPAAAFSVGTSTVAFAALMVSEFKGFSQLGIILAYGILVTCLSMFILTGIFLVCLHRLWPGLFARYTTDETKQAKEKKWHDRVNVPLIARISLVACFLISIGAFYLAPSIEWDQDMRNNVKSSLPSDYVNTEMDLRYELSGYPMGVAVETLDEAQALQEYFEPLRPEHAERITQLVAPHTFVPPLHRQIENHRVLMRFHAGNSAIKPAMIPAQYRRHYYTYLEMVSQKPFGIHDISPQMLDQFRAREDSRYKGWMMFIYPDVTKLDLQKDIVALHEMLTNIEYPIVSRHMILNLAVHAGAWERRTGTRIPGSRTPGEFRGLELSERGRNAALAIANNAPKDLLITYGLTETAADSVISRRPFDSVDAILADKRQARGTGSTILIASFTQLVLKEARTIVIMTIVLITLFLLVSYRNPASALVTLIPLMLGILWMIGAMVLIGMKINYFNVSVLPIIVGYGINNGIFIFYRYLQSSSVFTAVYRTGTAAIASSLTSLAGWGALIFLNHPGLQSMGRLAVVGLLSMLLMTLVFQPALLAIMERYTPGVIRYMRRTFERKNANGAPAYNRAASQEQ